LHVTRVSGDEPGQTIELPGGRLFVHTGGRTPEGAFPLVLFIHGAGQDHRVWGAVADHMAAHAMSVMNIDLPGHGATVGNPATSIGALAELVAELIGASEQGVASLVGNSMGGLVAVELASTRPDLVDRLVVVGTGARMPVSERLLTAAADDGTAANDLLSRWSHSRAVDDATRAESRAMRSDTPPGTLHAALLACDRYEDGKTRAGGVASPVLVIVGEDDVMVDRAEVDALVDALPSARLAVITGAGHDTMLDAPGDVIDAIERFFADHSSSR
jgi:pimeloyl-ACP methyl ester carboxylesterase